MFSRASFDPVKGLRIGGDAGSVHPHTMKVSKPVSTGVKKLLPMLALHINVLAEFSLLPNWFPMITALKKMALGLALIAGAAVLLLYSDLDSRRSEVHSKSRVMRVAVVQQISIPALDDGVSGALAALGDRGYSDGGRMILSKYAAQGDVRIANAIAKDVTSSNFDLILSFSTVSLQTIANANRFATPPRHHVFALVSDPYAVGVGVSRENHLMHPPYMTGLGSMAPVEEAFALARRMLPTLRRVGLVWDGSEANSLVTTMLARKTCGSMGITLGL